MNKPIADIVWLETEQQRLGVVPALGGGVAAWQWLRTDGAAPFDVWRPWSGTTDDRYTLASFAMLPWSNRISQGGFECEGRHYPMAPNRAGEPYPIHGDGWLQAWQFERIGAASAVMRLSSRCFDGNPYEYDAEQNFTLVDGGLDQAVVVTHRGEAPLPYGLGLHPWFLRSPSTRLQAQVRGVWLCGADPIPTQHTLEFPATWDLRSGADVSGGPLIDNAYTGWDGRATITWPEQGLALQMLTHAIETPRGPVAAEYCLLYRPPQGPSFCFEPVTQPIDPFHIEGRPGLVVLQRGQTLSMRVSWRVARA